MKESRAGRESKKSNVRVDVVVGRLGLLMVLRADNYHVLYTSDFYAITAETPLKETDVQSDSHCGVMHISASLRIMG